MRQPEYRAIAQRDVRWHSRVERDECRIVGTEGSIEMTPLNSGRLITPSGEEMAPPHANLHYPAVANFVAAALDGAALMCPGSEAVETDRVTGEIAVSSFV